MVGRGRRDPRRAGRRQRDVQPGPAGDWLRAVEPAGRRGARAARPATGRPPRDGLHRVAPRLALGLAIVRADAGPAGGGGDAGVQRPVRRPAGRRRGAGRCCTRRWCASRSARWCSRRSRSAPCCPRCSPCRWGVLRGCIVASVLFGLWHVLPALRSTGQPGGRHVFGNGRRRGDRGRGVRRGRHGARRSVAGAGSATGRAASWRR